jgi:hypothetical protein
MFRRQFVMAWLDRAIGINTMERAMARSSRAMTKHNRAVTTHNQETTK